MINDLPPEKSSARRPLQIKTAVLLKVLFSQYFQHQNIKPLFALYYCPATGPLEIKASLYIIILCYLVNYPDLWFMTRYGLIKKWNCIKL